MKVKNKRLFLYLSPLAIGALTAPLVISAGCSNKFTGFGTQYAEEHVLRSAIASSYSNHPYDIDRTNSYGSFQNRSEEGSLGLLVRKQTFGQPNVEATTDGLDLNFKVKEPSYWKYRFEIASKIILTVDGKEVVYDSDEAEVKPTKDKGDFYLNTSYQLTSKNAKSINSKQFEVDSKKASQFRIEIKNGIKWVDGEGKETTYEIVPDDFYVSWLRTYLLTTSSRVAAYNSNGVKTLDTLMASLLGPASKYFTKDTYYPNEYLYGLYDIDSSKFLKRDQFITKYNGKDVLTFNPAVGKTVGDFFSFFDNMSESYDFVAAPSQYIKEHLNNPVFEPFDNKDKLSELVKLIKDLPDNNLLKISGAYWYGANNNKLLFAGPYYYAGYNPNTQEESYVLNKHYWDKDFVNADDNIKLITRRYSNNADQETFKQFLWDEYLAGRISSLPYGALTESAQNSANSDPKLYNMHYVKPLNKSKQKQELLQRFFPGPNFGEKDEKGNIVKIDKSEYNFNDVYSTLMFGGPIDQVNDLTLDKYKTAISGLGLKFKTLINAAVNWNQVASTISNGKQKAWISTLAEDSNINGSDFATSDKKIVRDGYEQINTLRAFGEDGTKISTSPEENEQWAYNQSSNESKMQSAKYAEIQVQVTKLLDKFFELNPSLDGQKVKWDFVFRWTNWNPPAMQNVATILPQVINALDTKGRIEFDFIKYESAQKAKWAVSLTGATGAYKFAGWSYDYNGIGSGFDGYTVATFDGVLLALLGSDQLRNELKPMFPNIVAMVEELQSFIASTPAIELAVPIDKLSLMTSSQLESARSEFNAYKYDATTNKIVERDAEKGDHLATPFDSVLARFFKTLQGKWTNEQLLNLAEDLTSFVGVVPNTLIGTSTENFTPTLSNPYYIIPYTGGNTAWDADIKINNSAIEAKNKPAD